MKKGMRILAIVTVFVCLSYSTTAFSAKETKYNLTNDKDLVKMQHDKGYSIREEFGKDDPHYGWRLGQFYIQGYTDVVKDTDGTLVFLKNVGNLLTLGFDLQKNINKLGKNGNSQINEDTNGFDTRFEVGQSNFGKGCLIVVETDYRNRSHTPISYPDYLLAVQNKTANTEVRPFAEGDYTVALDYELKSPGFVGIPTYTDYSLCFKFKIRNSNCMVFFYKLGGSRDEITNGAVAEDGFRVDFKNSYFLAVTVTKEILVNNDGIWTLDKRFNRAVSDGDSFSDEGLYTITVYNQYTQERVTKRISVGHNKILNVYAAHGGAVDPNEIAKKLDQGIEVNDQWMMLLTEANAEDNSNTTESYYDGFSSAKKDDQENHLDSNLITPINVSIFAIAVIGLIMALKAMEKRKGK